MDEIKKYHYKRGKEMLRKSYAKPVSSFPIPSIQLVLKIPELLHMILQYTLPSKWPCLQLVCKSFEQSIKPLLWRNVSLDSPEQTRLILPFLGIYASLIHTLDLALLDQPSLSDISQELLFTNLNLVSLKLNATSIVTNQLQLILNISSQMRSIDIRGCILDSHPLDILSPYQHLESLAFDQSEIPLPQNPKIFSLWSNLKRLRIAFIATDPLVLSQFHEAISNCPLNINTLELEYYYISIAGTTLRNIISSNHHLSSLSSLSFISTELSTSALIPQEALLPSILSLRIHRCPGISGLECLYLVRACPNLKELDLEIRLPISLEVFEQISLAATELTSFSIKNSKESLRCIPKNCQKLRRFNVDGLSIGKYFTDLFEDTWGCRNLEELVINNVDFTVISRGDPEKVKVLKNQAMSLVWAKISTLVSLRVLILKGCDSRPEYYNRSKLKLLGTLSRLEVLCLMGFGPWEYNELLWVLDTFPWLEEFAYDEKELSIPLLAWLRNSSSSLCFSKKRTKSSKNRLENVGDYGIVVL